MIKIASHQSVARREEELMDGKSEVYLFDGLEVRPVPAGNSGTAYIVRETKTGKLLLIDPSYENRRAIANVLKMIGAEKVHTVFYTHPHFDHMDDVHKLFGGVVVCPEGMRPFLEGMRMTKVLHCGFYYTAKVDHEVKAGVRPFFGQWPFEIQVASGHSPYDCLLVGDGLMFSGDIAFMNGGEFRRGRTDLPFGDLDKFIEEALSMFLDNLRGRFVFPGHHEPFDETTFVPAFREWFRRIEQGAS